MIRREANMSDEDDPIAALEKRLARVERDLRGFKKDVVKKLTQAFDMVTKHQQLRDARVNEQLKRIALELTAIRQKMATDPPPNAMN
jgi:septal ring factor EnvC (AmiA/AmiB activator)